MNKQIRTNQQINKIKCITCNTELESKYRWDFQSCKCGNFVDGGLDYCRVGGNLVDVLFWNWEKDEWLKIIELEERIDKC